MRKFNWLVLSALINGLLLVQPLLVVSAVNIFNDPAFATTWNRVDKAVQDTPGAAKRGYTWGPQAPDTEAVTKEAYDGVVRKVQYFDKARMEINNPNGNPNDLFYVTTGLLVKELVMGYRQDGNTTFTILPPSTVQVAGDSNDGEANAIAPTYASFKNVGTSFTPEMLSRLLLPAWEVVASTVVTALLAASIVVVAALVVAAFVVAAALVVVAAAVVALAVVAAFVVAALVVAGAGVAVASPHAASTIATTNIPITTRGTRNLLGTV